MQRCYWKFFIQSWIHMVYRGGARWVWLWHSTVRYVETLHRPPSLRFTLPCYIFTLLGLQGELSFTVQVLGGVGRSSLVLGRTWAGKGVGSWESDPA